LTEVVGMSATGVEAMPPAQVLLLHMSHYYREVRDDVFKQGYLPPAQARLLHTDVEKILKNLPDTEAARVPGLFLPAIHKILLANLRIERRLTLLMAIEALRMHAAKNGQLPDKLDQVTIVPVPNDPGTDQPFEYQRDGQTATLVSRVAGEPLETTGIRYRVTLRK